MQRYLYDKWDTFLNAVADRVVMTEPPEVDVIEEVVGLKYNTTQVLAEADRPVVMRGLLNLARVKHPRELTVRVLLNMPDPLTKRVGPVRFDEKVIAMPAQEPPPPAVYIEPIYMPSGGRIEVTATAGAVSEFWYRMEVADVAQ